MSFSIWIYSLLSVLVVSLISLIGIVTVGIKITELERFLIYLISFSAGALFGDAFIHLLPEAVEVSGFSLSISLYVLLGIVIFFILEKVIHWHHCHRPINEGEGHIHRFAYMNLFGDALHNFIDGLVIASAYLISIPAGLATTIAVMFHEIPQEIGDFGVLIHGGFSKSKALMLNFLSALVALLGVFVAFFIKGLVSNIELIFVPIAVGGFIYIAGSDLIPELNKNCDTNIKQSLLKLFAFILGILIMIALLSVD